MGQDGAYKEVRHQGKSGFYGYGKRQKTEELINKLITEGSSMQRLRGDSDSDLRRYEEDCPYLQM